MSVLPVYLQPGDHGHSGLTFSKDWNLEEIWTTSELEFLLGMGSVPTICDKESKKCKELCSAPPDSCPSSAEQLLPS